MILTNEDRQAIASIFFALFIISTILVAIAGFVAGIGLLWESLWT